MSRPTGSQSRGRQWSVGLGLALGGVAPLMILVFEVARLGLNAPFSDEWVMVPFLQRAAAGTLSLGNLWAQHNEHRQFFPSLVLVALARSTHWSLRAELLANVGFGALIALILVVVVVASFRRMGSGLTLTMSLAAIWFSLSPAQWENWLWGWDLCWFLTVLGMVAAIAIVAHPPPWLSREWALACAVAGGVLASYSLSNGLIVWPAGAAVLALRRWPRRLLLAWAGAAIVTVAVFFIGYRHDATSPRYVVSHLGQLGQYVLVNLGAPVLGSSSLPLNAILGAGLVATFCGCGLWIARRQPGLFQDAAGWLGLGGLAVMSAVLTGIGRSSQGVGQAASSRYFTVSTLFLLATLALGLLVTGSWWQRQGVAPRDRAGLLAVIGLVLAGLLAAGYHAGFAGFDYRHQVMGVVRYCEVHATGPQDPCLAGVYPDTQTAWEWLQYLRAHHLAGLAPLHPPESGGPGSG